MVISRRQTRLMAALALGAVLPAVARAQQEFPQTLYWGSGLIDIPVAWAPPLTGDFALGYSGNGLISTPSRRSSITTTA